MKQEAKQLGLGTMRESPDRAPRCARKTNGCEIQKSPLLPMDCRRCKGTTERVKKVGRKQTRIMSLRGGANNKIKMNSSWRLVTRPPFGQALLYLNILITMICLVSPLAASSRLQANWWQTSQVAQEQNVHPTSQGGRSIPGELMS